MTPGVAQAKQKPKLGHGDVTGDVMKCWNKQNASYYSFIALVCKYSYHFMRTEEDNHSDQGKTDSGVMLSHASLSISLDINLLEMLD